MATATHGEGTRTWPVPSCSASAKLALDRAVPGHGRQGPGAPELAENRPRAWWPSWLAPGAIGPLPMAPDQPGGDYSKRH